MTSPKALLWLLISIAGSLVAFYAISGHQEIRVACGTGTIAFRPPHIRTWAHVLSAHPERFGCGYSDEYADGVREYRAELSAPPAGRFLTLVLLQTGGRDNGTRTHVLDRQTIPVRPSVTGVEGSVTFAKKFRGSPFGTYTVELRRGDAQGMILARGSFEVIED